MVDIAKLPHATTKEKKEMAEKYGMKVGELKKNLPPLLHRVEQLHEFNRCSDTGAAGWDHLSGDHRDAGAGDLRSGCTGEKEGRERDPRGHDSADRQRRRTGRPESDRGARSPGSSSEGRREESEVHDRNDDRDSARGADGGPGGWRSRVLQLRHQRPHADDNGLSRDDYVKFSKDYENKKIFKADPFAVLDQEGVGKLVDMAVKLGRGARPDLEVGICGEHGGEPSSVEFCYRVGMDYVSCSPYRVPIARLAAAQAAITSKTAGSKAETMRTA